MKKPEYKWMVEPSRRLRVMYMICEEFGVTPDELKGDLRTREIFRARAVFSYITRKHFDDTLQRIGRELGADHASIKYQLMKIDELIFKNDPLKRRIQKLEQELLQKQLI